jgi:hypothetical protein
MFCIALPMYLLNVSFLCFTNVFEYCLIKNQLVDKNVFKVKLNNKNKLHLKASFFNEQMNDIMKKDDWKFDGQVIDLTLLYDMPNDHKLISARKNAV